MNGQIANLVNWEWRTSRLSQFTFYLSFWVRIKTAIPPAASLYICYLFAFGEVSFQNFVFPFFFLSSCPFFPPHIYTLLFYSSLRLLRSHIIFSQELQPNNVSVVLFQFSSRLFSILELSLCLKNLSFVTRTCRQRICSCIENMSKKYFKIWWPEKQAASS